MTSRSFVISRAARLAAVLGLLIACIPLHAADKTAELDAYLTAAHSVNRFQGVALVAKNGAPIFQKGYGMASVELNVPNTPIQKFLIGSVTKQFTAAAIMQLQEQGKLNVGDPITKYLTTYPEEPGARITIHHLLTHTSGLPSYTDDPGLMNRRTIDMSMQDLVDTFKDKPLQFEPGTQYRYCNSGYFLLGMIIETVSGKTYEEYLRDHFFAPLGMANTGYTHNEVILPDRTCGYGLDDTALVNASPIAMTLPYAAGALYSTVGDLLVWDQALYGTGILSEKSKQLMYTPGKENYGYGWVIQEMAGHKAIFHDGGIDGFTSHFARYPDDSLTVVVLCNNQSVSSTPIGFSLANIVFDQPYDLPVRKTPIAADPASYDAYTGVYRASESAYRMIRRDGDALYSQRTGGPVFQIYPEAPDKFYYENDNSTTVTFVRDEQAAVVAHVMHQGGADTRCERVTGPLADSLMAVREAAKVDPAVFERYVGDYELAPGFVLTFRTRDGRIFSQATGQEELEIFPSSETEFFLRVVDAQITFELDAATSRATGLVLHQGGREMPARRIR